MEIRRRYESFSLMINFDHAAYLTLLNLSASIKFSPQSLFHNADINGDGTLELDEVR